jgi:hypothetical protein
MTSALSRRRGKERVGQFPITPLHQLGIRAGNPPANVFAAESDNGGVKEDITVIVQSGAPEKVVIRYPSPR